MPQLAKARIDKGILSPEQQRFLQFRAWTKTDQEAARLAGVERNVVRYWKKEPAFAEAYNNVAERVMGPLFDAAVDIVQNRLSAEIMDLIDEHIRLAKESKSDATRLRAINLAYEVLGLVGPGRRLPPAVNETLKQALQALGSVYMTKVNEARQEIIDAEYEELE